MLKTIKNLKNKYSLFILMLLTVSIFGQETKSITLTRGSDAMLLDDKDPFSPYADRNFSAITWLGAGAYYRSSRENLSHARGVLNFSNCEVANGATIKTAKILLRQRNFTVNGQNQINPPNHTNTNGIQYKIQAYTPPIIAETCTWNNLTAQSSTDLNTMNFSVNAADSSITSIVLNQSIINSLNELLKNGKDFSFLISSSDETHENWATFGSFETSSAPSLEITYVQPTCTFNSNWINGYLDSNKDLTKEPNYAFVGVPYTYTLKISNLSCFDANNLSLNLNNTPFGAEGLKITQIINDLGPGSLNNGRPVGQIKLNPDGTINLEANSSGAIKFNVTYTSVSQDAFCQDFNLISPRPSEEINSCIVKPFSTCNNFHMQVTNGNPASLSHYQFDINTSIKNALPATSLSIHQQYTNVKSLELDFQYDTTYLRNMTCTLNPKLVKIGASYKVKENNSGHIYFTLTIPDNYVVNLGAVNSEISKEINIAQNDAILTYNFNFNKLPSCKTFVIVNSLMLTQGAKNTAAYLLTNPSHIGIFGEKTACGNLDASFIAVTKGIKHHKINTPIVFIANDTTGVHFWKIGGTNGLLLDSASGKTTYIFKQSGDYIIEHTITKGNLMKIYTQTIRVNNTRTLRVGVDAWVGSRYPNTNFGTYPLEAPANYVANSTNYTGRSLIKFNLCEMPKGTNIVSANLILKYADNEPNTGFVTHFGDHNTGIVKKVASNWSDTTVTWATQPNISELNSVVFGGPNSINENFTIPVTNLVNDMVQNSTNYGFQLALEAENPINYLVFGSFENTNENLRPTMEIDFYCPDNNCNPCDPNTKPINDITEITDDYSEINIAQTASPNPFESVINLGLGFENVTKSNLEISIFDARGNKIPESTYHISSKVSNYIQLEFDAQLQSGMYMVKASQEDQNATFKIIKK